MTIKIERDAFLRVITRKGPLIEKAQQQQRDEEEFVVVTLPSKDDFFYNDLIPVSADDDDDDQASLLSLSTDSSSTSSGTAEDDAQERRVTFAEDLVTDVFTRERTLPEEVPRLFYTSMETQTFRQQYRFERKATVTSPHSSAGSKNTPLSSPLSSSRHHISRVVVLHNDKLETFFHQGDEEGEEKNEDDLLASLVSPSVSPEPLSSTVPFAPTSSSSDDFFDSDSFWTGSLTWY
ncbi:hypothetical protein IV203_028857 [Nitzschia inconspicua]|uniref:Uncharacterized protein n=1 Tax=Nitzschia inconspicua TaxID=303405 RepID=A0A9K3LQ28_9STRA|nr:hypothetical protein IV203_028857 [Nitzschia inconspicua]